jgi:membrane-bound serine protease (ClpP class)
MKKLYLLGVIFIFLSLGNSYAQQSDTKQVFVFDIDEEIAPPVVRRMEKAFNQAKELKSDLIILHMNTYGGMVVSADTIRTRILNSKIPVVVFIDNNAASAGALISIACDSIYMRSGANIGAATVVNQNAEAMPDKYQSYMRATMRATAEAKGRDPHIAEAMVDQDIYIPEISDSGKVLTFTTSEAIKNGFCEAEVSSIDELIKRYGFKSFKIDKIEIKAADKFIDFFISPYVHGILIMIIIGGIYFELQTPGMGFPSAAAIVASLLYFAPLYAEGLAENWELLIFVAGIILIILEVFVIPGFGIAGVGGIVLVVVGLVLSLLNNIVFDFSMVSFDSILEATFVVIIAIFGAMILAFIGVKHILSSPRFGLTLNTEIGTKSGFEAVNFQNEELVGEEGFTKSILRPAGKIEINNKVYDAVSQESYIDKGERVKVVKQFNSQLQVRKV